MRTRDPRDPAPEQARSNGALGVALRVTLATAPLLWCCNPTCRELRPMLEAVHNLSRGRAATEVFAPHRNGGSDVDLPRAANRAPGTREGPLGSAMIELRGWLRSVSDECNPVDPDYHYNVELDPDWMASQQLNPGALLRARDIREGIQDESLCSLTFDRTGGFARCSLPRLHIELSGVPSTPERRGRIDPRWVQSSRCPARPGAFGGASIHWPFDPVAGFQVNAQRGGDARGAYVPPLAPGQYVRVRGGLVTDAPHWGGVDPGDTLGREELILLHQPFGDPWGAGLAWRENPESQARWSEIHPPDVIAPICCNDRRATSPLDWNVSRDRALVGMYAVMLPSSHEHGFTVSTRLCPVTTAPAAGMELVLDEFPSVANGGMGEVLSERRRTNPDGCRIGGVTVPSIEVTRTIGTTTMATPNGVIRHGRYITFFSVGWRRPTCSAATPEVAPCVQACVADCRAQPGSVASRCLSECGARCCRDRGTPSDDRDIDGVPDARDLCPDIAAGSRPDPEHSGCPAAPPDRDRDGLVDGADPCPDEAPGNRPDPARPGCPLPTVTDRDGDGVEDARDQCPGRAAGAQPDPARPGCPARRPAPDPDCVPDCMTDCTSAPGAPPHLQCLSGCRRACAEGEPP